MAIKKHKFAALYGHLVRVEAILAAPSELGIANWLLPQDTCDAFPAVIVPLSFWNAGSKVLNLASFNFEGPSSHATSPFSPIGIETCSQDVSSLNLIALWNDSIAQSSCASRVMLYSAAHISPQEPMWTFSCGSHKPSYTIGPLSFLGMKIIRENYISLNARPYWHMTWTIWQKRQDNFRRFSIRRENLSPPTAPRKIHRPKPRPVVCDMLVALRTLIMPSTQRKSPDFFPLRIWAGK